MKFRPCIDIHNGKVKQIVGGSLADKNNQAKDNYVSDYDASYYGELYKNSGLTGGHIIILNKEGTEFYDADKKQAFSALSAFEGGLQVGGGITADNAMEYLNAGASHVIVTSYVFKDGAANQDNLDKLVSVTGKKRLVLDLSCRKKDDGFYYIVTDRWQNFTDTVLCDEVISRLAEYCDEFLVHAVDVEGKANGIENELAAMLGRWNGLPVTYAGGIGSFDDLNMLKISGNGNLDFTVGSALDIFGGNMKFEDVVNFR